MKVQDCCHNMEMELSSWKSKLENVDRDIQRVPSIDKYKMLGSIESLHMILAELDDRINDLRTSCTTEWRSEGEEPTIKGEDWGGKVESTQ